MKNIIRLSFRQLALGLSLGLALASCQDAIDLNPQQSVEAGTALDSPTKVGSAVVGIYAKLDDPRLYGTDLILVPELIAADNYLQFEGTFKQYQQIAFRSSLTSLNSTAEGIWRRAYQAINQANLVLDALPVVTNAAQATQFGGEARFLRAAMYFELVRLYARQYQAGGGNDQPGVPLVLSGALNTEQAGVLRPRASVEAVYVQVIADLTAAIAQLPADNGTRATRYAAEALLARVYLQQGNYPAARTAANNVIENSGRALVGSVAAVFANRNSAESLFEIQQNEQNNAGAANDGLATLFASDGGFGRGDVRVEGDFAAQYEDEDVRGTDSLPASQTRKLIYLGDGARPDHLRTLKWRTFSQNIPVIRLAEMYLIRAEADVRAGNVADATADVNRIRQRSGATPLAAVTLDDVLHERQLELAFEGFYSHDLKRTGTNVALSDSTELPISSPLLTLPIPQHDLNLNPQLVQNPGY